MLRKLGPSMMSAASRTTSGMTTRMTSQPTLKSMATSAAADVPQRPPRTRDEYGFFLDIPTRWKDNDQFGHINNGDRVATVQPLLLVPHTHA